MTTDHAAAAAEEIVAEIFDETAGACSRKERRDNVKHATDEVAAIIRRHYDDQGALLRRAVEAIALLKTWLGTEHSRDAINTADAVLADAERLGITGDAK